MPANLVPLPLTLGVAAAMLTRSFAEAGLDGPARDARVLVAAAAGVGTEMLLAHPDRPLDAEAAARALAFCRRRIAREPVARILGRREFYGRAFEIGPDVLDPRPDTETLVDLALGLVREAASAGRRLRILDVGTGSGCIAVTLLAELATAEAVATDVSAAALALARHNAAVHGVVDRLDFVQTDVADGIAGPFDLIVSNPPYIAREVIATLEPEVRCHDPVLALDGGVDGLTIYRHLAVAAPRLLVPGGWIAVEVGIGQASAVEQMFTEGLWQVPELTLLAGAVHAARDLAGVLRCVAVQAHSSVVR